MRTLPLIFLILGIFTIQSVYGQENLPSPTRTQESMTDSYLVEEFDFEGYKILEFQGRFSWAYYDSMPKGPNGEFSVCFWVYANFPQHDLYADIVNFVRVGGIYDFIRVYRNHQRIQADFDQPGSTTNQFKSPQIEMASDWSHFIFQYTGSAYEVYINGQQITSESTNQVIETPSDSYILLAHNLSGYITEFAMYDVALTYEQINGSDQMSLMHLSSQITKQLPEPKQPERRTRKRSQKRGLRKNIVRNKRR